MKDGHAQTPGRSQQHAAQENPDPHPYNGRTRVRNLVLTFSVSLVMTSH